MTPTQRNPSRASSLLQVLASYLCLILVVQGWAAAAALGAGPLHRHAPAPPVLLAPPAPPVLLAPLAFSHHGHAHAHATGARHHHAAADRSVAHEADPAGAFDAVAFALTSALALLALDTPRAPAERRRQHHVLQATPAWAAKLAQLAQPYRPPRLG